MIELMIVMILITLLVMVSARSVGGKNYTIKAAVRRMAVTMKRLRNRARLENRTYRIVFDLPEDKDKPQNYWVESTSKNALLLDEEALEEMKEAIEDDDENFGKKEDELPDPQGFKQSGKLSELPKGLYIDAVEIVGHDKEYKKGRVYIYYFPQGFVQQAAVHITDRDKLNWTLAIHPLTGRVDVLGKRTSLEELRQ